MWDTENIITSDSFKKLDNNIFSQIQHLEATSNTNKHTISVWTKVGHRNRNWTE